MYVVKHTSLKLVIHTWVLSWGWGGGVYNWLCAISCNSKATYNHDDSCWVNVLFAQSQPKHKISQYVSCKSLLACALSISHFTSSLQCYVYVCNTGHSNYWILSTLARLTAPAGVDLILLVHTHWKTTKKQKTSVWSKIHLHTDTNTKWTLPWKRT